MASTNKKKQCQLKHTPGTETVGSKKIRKNASEKTTGTKKQERNNSK